MDALELPLHDDLAVVDAVVAGLASEGERAGLAHHDVRADVALQAQLVLVGVLLNYEDRLQESRVVGAEQLLQAQWKLPALAFSLY